MGPENQFHPAGRNHVARRSSFAFSTLVILALAALIRLWTVWFAVTHPTVEWPVFAGNEEAILGRSLLAGQGLSSPFGGSTGPTAFVAPGYPVLVAGVYRIFGPHTNTSTFVVLLLQLIFAVATIAVVMHMARRVFDDRTATIAGIFWAFSPPLMWMPTIFWDTCVSALMLTSLVALALHCCKKPTMALWFSMGALTGLAGLINPSLLPALIAVMAWCAYRQRKLATLRWQPVIALLVLLIVYSPWPIRNLKVMHAFVPMRSNLGFELWNGNRPGSNGKFTEDLHPYYNPAEFARYATLGEMGYMQEKSSLAKANIEAHPVRFVAISFSRVGQFWLGLAQPKDKVSSILVLHALLTTLGGAAGLLLLFKKNRVIAWLFLLPLLVFPLPYYLTHADLRFRLLVDPLLAILGAYAFARLLAHLTVEPTAELAAVARAESTEELTAIG